MDLCEKEKKKKLPCSVFLLACLLTHSTDKIRREWKVVIVSCAFAALLQPMCLLHARPCSVSLLKLSIRLRPQPAGPSPDQTSAQFRSAKPCCKYLAWLQKLNYVGTGNREVKKKREKNPATSQTITLSKVRFSHVLLVSSAFEAEKRKVYLFLINIGL